MDREGRRGREGVSLQGGGGVVDDVGTEGEDRAVEEVEHRHLVLLVGVVVSGAWATARSSRLILRDDFEMQVGNGLEMDPIELSNNNTLGARGLVRGLRSSRQADGPKWSAPPFC